MIFGIDLGTSKCAVSRYILGSKGRDGEPIIVGGQDGFEPSIVYFLDNDEYFAGRKAWERYLKEPDSGVELIKVRLGRVKEIPVRINGNKKEFKPQFIMSLMIKHMKNKMYGYSNKAIITVPAYFDQNQRQATLEAGELAGLEIIQLIEEPSAALLYHIFRSYKDGKLSLDEFPQNYLVFDFGGGTLDLSLVKVNVNGGRYIEPEVLLVGGDPDLGGNLIDFEIEKAIVRYIFNSQKDSFTEEVYDAFNEYYKNYMEKKQLTFKETTSQSVREFITSLKQACEEIKIRLSEQPSDYIATGGHLKPIRIRREDLEGIINRSNIRKRIKDAVSNFLNVNSNDKRYSIDRVVLVGGASRMPYIKTILEDEFPAFRGKIEYAVEARECVAKGAAILGAIEEGIVVPPFGGNPLKSVLAYDIYVEHEGEEKLFISYGERYPFAQPHTYTLRVEHSLKPYISIKFKEKEFATNKEAIINDIKFYHPCFYTGDEILLQLRIDEKGIYRFSAVHVDTNEKINFESDKLYVLSDQERAMYQEYVQKMQDKS